MYERFTDRARKVMQLANQEARRFNHYYISSEHILLGLIRQAMGSGSPFPGTAAFILKYLNVDLAELRDEIEKGVVLGNNYLIEEGTKLPLGPTAKRSLDYAIIAASDLNHNYVGTEHILLGMLMDGEKDPVTSSNYVAILLSRKYGLTTGQVIAAIKNVLGHKDDAPPPSTEVGQPPFSTEGRKPCSPELYRHADPKYPIGAALIYTTYNGEKPIKVACGYVLCGVIKKTSRIRILRGRSVIFPTCGGLASIKAIFHYSTSPEEVVAGTECGIIIDGYNDFESGDVIQAY